MTEIKSYPLPIDCYGDRSPGAHVDTIMLHFISAVRDYPDSPYDMDKIFQIFCDYKISAHYLIGRRGSIYSLVPEEKKAFHAGAEGCLTHRPETQNCLNDRSIGIELMGIGTQEEMAFVLTADEYKNLNPEFIGYTDAQYRSLNFLIDRLHTRYPLIKKARTHIVGHNDYTPTKPDPGLLFDWSKIVIAA